MTRPPVAHLARLLGALILSCGTTAMAQDKPEPAVFDQPPAAEIVILNARIWTGVPAEPDAEALAIASGRITAVGTSAEVRALAGPQTQAIDAGGRRIIPGITDGHTHFIEMGLQLARVDLRSAVDRSDFVNRVAAQVARMNPGEWVLGGQYTVDSWADPAPPEKSWIDAVTPGNPVFLNRMDGHQGLANSVALKYARIDRDGPPDPPGGEIVRDPVTREPTGILKDEAMALVTRQVPPSDERKLYDALLAACRVANAWGVTGVHDMTDLPQLPILQMADERGTLSVRVRSYVQTEDFQDNWPKLRAQYPPAGRMFTLAGLKSYMDGSLGSRTAFMRAPFSDSTADAKYPRGFLMAHAGSESFPNDIRWAHDHGAQLAVHAIGDEANHRILDIYAGLPDGAARHHRVEHAQHLLPEDIARFARLGVVASMQPLHKADDGRWAEAALGPERARTTYAFKDLLDAGAIVVFGSDTPVVTMNPFLGMQAAVTARTLDGKTWVPEQRISREACLRCYTSAPHVAAGTIDRGGTVEVGKWADLAVLDGDILNMPVEELGNVEAYLTIVDGRIVHQQAALRAPAEAPAGK